jgi:dihydrolipoamide dehydrogenase
MSKYDLIVIGSGPGGYPAAIRASQLGMKVAIVEKENLGGVCLNWGCIPSKALLKTANVFDYVNHAGDYGIKIDQASIQFDKVIERSRNVANGMSKGVQFLMKKNKIDVLEGFGKVKKDKQVEVSDENGKNETYQAGNVIIATGGRSKNLPNMPQDGKKIIGYREAMTLEKQPKKMVVVGGGAIGSEFAYFYNAIGTEVTIVEALDHLVPVEDEEVSKTLERSFKKSGISLKLGASVESVDTKGKNCKVKVKTQKGEEETIDCDVVLSAVGIDANIENMGLEDVGIATDKGKIQVNEKYETTVPGYYAIGDCIPGPALAHLGTHEALNCVERIAGMDPGQLDYNNNPSCTYTFPEVASVGYTEQQAKDQGYELKIGNFPFSASGKASAAGHTEGFVKVIFDAKYGEWLGAHMIGAGVTELIAEVVAARKLETTGHEIIKSIHPHPTMSEAVMEAAAAAYDEVIHI